MTAKPRTKSRLFNKAAAKRLTALILVLSLAILWCYFTMIRMPGTSYHGPLPPLTESQRLLAGELRQHVQALAGDIVKRSVVYKEGLAAAADYIEGELTGMGFQVQRQSYDVWGVQCPNLEVEIKGASRPDEILIIGAHYDSFDDSPAANDNASGVAATLALARSFANQSKGSARTIRFVLFANEEPPFFQTQDMGSLVYAKRCRERHENIVGMISLETIGYYSDEPGSQAYPIKPIGWLYPNQGNFIAFVGNVDSRHFLRSAIRSFRQHAKFPSEGAALPGWIEGVGWSDHWAFWQMGYPAFMATDTAPFRYPHYHTNHDSPEKLDYEAMARVVEGFASVIRDLANGN